MQIHPVRIHPLIAISPTRLCQYQDVNTLFTAPHLQLVQFVIAESTAVATKVSQIPFVLMLSIARLEILGTFGRLRAYNIDWRRTFGQ